MKKSVVSKLFWIFLAVLILAVYSVWGQDITRKLFKKADVDWGFSGFKPENTKSITILQGTIEINLTHDDGKWRVASYSASVETIDTFFNTLKNVKLQNVVSRNPTNRKEYGFTDERQIRLTVVNTAGKHEYFIGDKAPALGSFYLTRPQTDIVYVADGDLPDQLKTAVSDWRDKTLIRTESDKISRIEIIGRDKSEITKNQGDSWTITSGGQKAQIPAEEMAVVTNSLAGLQGYDFLNSTEEKQFTLAVDKPVLNIYGSEGGRIASITYLNVGSDIYMEVQGGEDVMKVYGSQLEGLFKLTDKLKK